MTLAALVEMTVCSTFKEPLEPFHAQGTAETSEQPLGTWE